MVTTRRTKTWRVRGLGLNCSDDCLVRLLSQAPDNDSQNPDNFQIESLAIEYNGRSKTATVGAPANLALPEELPSCAEHHQADRRHVNTIDLDDAFDDLTTLFAPPATDCELE